MWFCAGIIVGIALTSQLLPWVGFSLLPGGLAIMLLLYAVRGRTAIAIFIVFAIGIFFGATRATPLHQDIRVYEPFVGQEVVVQGIVSEDVSFAENGGQNIQIKNVQIDGRHLPAKVWIQTPSRKVIKRSDLIVIQGKLTKGFGVIPAAMYRAQIMYVHTDMYNDVGRSIRDWFAGKIRLVIGEPEASLGIGYLVGQRSELPPDINDAMRVLGLTHVVVASGYNLTILVRFTRRIFAPYSKYVAFILAVIMVSVFVAMTGASPSMSRAALVTLLSLMALYFGRTVQPLVLLSIVGAATALINPFYVWGDLGWYLSMLSFAGVMIIAPLVRHYFFGADAKLSFFPSIFIETMSAQIATFPLLAYTFGQYSLFALPANMLILPLIPFAMAATFLAGVIAVCAPPIGGVVHWPATVVLSYMTSVVRYLAALPDVVQEVQFGVKALIIGYIAMVALCIRLWRKTGHNFGKDNIIE